jgi:hypothetical protein
MAIIKNAYVGDGSTVLYSFTFPYIKEDDVKVSIDGVDTTAYTLANATTVEFTTAPAVDAAILIYRQTQVDDIENVFFPGSAIRAKDLNDNFTQSIYVIQEADDTAEQAKTIAEGSVDIAEDAVTEAEGATVIAGDAVTTADNAVASAAAANVTAASAVTTAESAVTTAESAVASAATANTTAANAVTTAQNAVTSAAQANATAASAVTTAQTAEATADNAVQTAQDAVTTADNADTNAANALQLVGQVISYVPVDDVSAIYATPSEGDSLRVRDSTGIENFSPLSNIPANFVGSSILYVDIVYTGGSINSWEFIQYGVLDTDARYVQLTGSTMTGPLEVPAGAVGAEVPQAQEVAFLDGATFTGAVNVPAGATGTEAPQAQEVAFLAGATFTGPVEVPAGATGAEAPQAQEVAFLSGATFTGSVFVPGGPYAQGSVPRVEDVANAQQGALAQTSIQPNDNVSELTNDAGYLTPADAIDATTLNSLTGDQFIRSDADDNVAAHTEWQDNYQARFGNGADMRIYHDGTSSYIDNNTNHIYIRSNVDGDDGGNIYIQAKAGENSIVCNDDSSTVLYSNGAASLSAGTNVTVYNDLIPDADNTGNVGTTDRTFASGRFTNFTVDSTLSVRGAIDLADSDILRFGSGDDVELFCNGSHMYMDLNSGIGNFYIRDGSTTRFTFDDAGHFTATGTITAGTFANAGVRNGYKSSSAGQSGTYAFLGTHTSYDAKTAGGTVSGTYLRYSNALASSPSGTPSGSWRLCGRTGSGNNNYGEAGTSLYLRYA